MQHVLFREAGSTDKSRQFAPEANFLVIWALVDSVKNTPDFNRYFPSGWIFVRLLHDALLGKCLDIGVYSGNIFKYWG